MISRSVRAAARAVVEAIEPRRLLSGGPTINIPGVVYSDANGNGRRDFGEAGLAGRTVFADFDYDGVLDAGEPSGVSRPGDGAYLVFDLEPNDGHIPFALRLVAAAGGTQTAPANNQPHYAEIRNDVQVLTGTDFGVHLADVPPDPLGQRLQPYVYVDANNNGRRDAAESGPAGQTIFADYDYDGVRDADEPGGVTDASGGADFRVAARPFALRLLTANGVTQSSPANDGPQYFVPGTSGVVGTGLGFIVSTTAPVGTGILDVDFFADYDADGVATAVDGDYPAVSFRSAFIDANRNDAFDAGDRYLSVGVYTGGGYYYYFDGLAAGTYHVVVNAGLTPGESIVGGNARDVSVLADGRASLSVPVAGYAYAKLSPNLFFDTNGNGLQDAGERTAAAEQDNLTIYVDLDFNGRQDENEPTAGLSNHYGRTPTFHLLPGSYSIRVRNNDGPAVVFAYGATSRWVTIPRPGVYTTQLGVAMG